jgi:hypothetical protein
MPMNRPVDVQEARDTSFVEFLNISERRVATRGRDAKRQRHGSPVVHLLTIAACLTAGFVAFICLEAFDADLNLWPSGVEDFTIASAGAPRVQPVQPFAAQHAKYFIAAEHDSTLTGGQPSQPPISPHAVLGFVISAGALLALRHRARSTLAFGPPFGLIACEMAEPWWQEMCTAPRLGHFFLSLSLWIRHVSRGPLALHGRPVW